MSRWFKPFGETAAKIEKIIAEREVVGKAAEKLMKKVGATGFRTYGGNFEVLGFDFKEKPDPKLWKLAPYCKKRGIEYYVPKKTTNLEVFNEMAKLKHCTQDEIGDVIDFKKMNIKAGRTGFYIESFGWDFVKGSEQMVLQMPDRFDKVKGCKRISDVEKEKLCGKSKQEDDDDDA